MTRRTPQRNAPGANIVPPIQMPLPPASVHGQANNPRLSSTHLGGSIDTDGNDHSMALNWTELLSNAMWQFCTSETFSSVQVWA
jgi:hypothetical protein